MNSAIHADDVANLKTVTDIISRNPMHRDEIAELVGLIYAIGRNRGGLEGAMRVADQIVSPARTGEPVARSNGTQT